MTLTPPVPPCADLWVGGVELAPGSVGVVTVQLRNRLDVAAEFSLGLSGVEADWVRGPAVIGPVRPGEVVATELQIRLPVGYPAADLVAAVSVRPVGLGAALVPATADLLISIGDGSAIGAALDPVEVRGVHGGRFAVVLRNSGKTPIRVDLRADVPDADMRVGFSSDAPILEPGRELRVKARIRASRPVLGPVQRRHFAVRVQGRTTPVVLEGSLTQRPVFSPWWLKAVALVAVVALWAAVAVVGISALSKHVKRSATAKAIAGAPPLTPNHNPSGASGGASGTNSGGANGSNGGRGGGSSTGGGANGSGGSGTARIGGRVTASQAGGVRVTVAPTSLVAAAAEGAKTTGGQVVTTAAVSGAPTPSSPIPDGKVYASEASASLDPELTVATSPTLGTTTTPDGSWAVAGLTAPGTYLVTFSKAGYGTEKYIEQATSAGSTITLNTALTAGNGAISGRVIGPSGLLGGVEVAITDGTIKIDTRTPSVGAGVGTWSATGLTTPGTYLITATDPGFGTQTSVVTLAPGATSTGVTLTMSSGTGDITGTVSSAGGPQGGITVTAAGDDTSVTTTTSTVNPIGSYTLPNLPIPGTYAVTVSGAGWQTQTQRVTLPDSHPVDAELQAATGDVYGTITVGTDDTTPSGVGIILSDQTTVYKTLTANNGSYEFQGIPPGTYLLTAEYYGDQTRSAEVTVRAGAEHAPVDLHLPPNGANSNGQGSIQGVAVDLFSSGPAAGISVELDGVQQYTGKHRAIVTSAQGTYTIDDVAPGEHLVTLVDHHEKSVPPGRCESFNLETESVDVEVPLNGVGIAPTVDMPKLDEYCGVVQSAATLLPIAGATITFLEPGHDTPVPGVAASTTDADGRFALTGIPAGSYKVQVTGPQSANESEIYRTLTFGLTMNPDDDLQQQTIDLTLLPSFQVVTEQVNTAGTGYVPITGVCVTLENDVTHALQDQYTGEYPTTVDKSTDNGELYFAPLTPGISYTATYTQYPSGQCPSTPTTTPVPGDPTANPTTFTPVDDNTAITRVFVNSNVSAVTLTLQYNAEIANADGTAGSEPCAIDEATASGACSSYAGSPLTATLTGVASFDASGNPVTGTVTTPCPMIDPTTKACETNIYMFTPEQLSTFIGPTVTLTVSGSADTFDTFTQTYDLGSSASANITATVQPQPVPVTGVGAPTSGLMISTQPSSVQVSEGPGGQFVWSDPESSQAGAAVPGLYTLTFSAHDYEPSSYTSTVQIPLCGQAGCSKTLNDSGLNYEPSATITPNFVTSPATVTLYYNGAACGAPAPCPGMSDADAPVILASGSAGGATFTGLSPAEEQDALPGGSSPGAGYTFSVVEDGYQSYYSLGDPSSPSDSFEKLTVGPTSDPASNLTNLVGTLTPEPYLTGTIDTYPVAGSAASATHSALAGATVTAQLTSCPVGSSSSSTTNPPPGISLVYPTTLLSTTTGDDGTFALYGDADQPSAMNVNGGLCPGGTYTVTVDDAGYTGPSGWTVTTDGTDDPDDSFKMTGTGANDLGGGTAGNPVPVQLDAALIRQTITVENADGTALPTDLPVSISGYPEVSNAESFGGISENRSLLFAFGNLTACPGQNTVCATIDAVPYNVTVSAAGYEPLYAVINDGPSASAPTNITYKLVADQNTISGVVTTGSHSTPVVGLKLYLYVSGDNPPQPPPDLPAGDDPTTTQSASPGVAAGSYSFTDVPDGSYYIVPATTSGYSLPSSPVSFSTSYPSPITQNISVVGSAVVLNVNVAAPALHDANAAGATVTLTPDATDTVPSTCTDEPSATNPPTECTGTPGSILVRGGATGTLTETLSGSGTAFGANFSSVTPDYYKMVVSGPGIPNQTAVILEVDPNTGTGAETAHDDLVEGEVYGSVSFSRSLSNSAPTVTLYDQTDSETVASPSCAVGGCPILLYVGDPRDTYTLSVTLFGYDEAKTVGFSPGSDPNDNFNAGTLRLDPTDQTVTITTKSDGANTYPLTGATVTLSDPATNYKVSQTVTSGPVTFDNVPPDTNNYNVAVDFDQATDNTGLPVPLGTAGTVDSTAIVVPSGQLTGTVTYAGAGNPTLYFCPGDQAVSAASCGASNSIASVTPTGATYTVTLPDNGYWVGQSVETGYTSNTQQTTQAVVSEGGSTTGPGVIYKA